MKTFLIPTSELLQLWKLHHGYSPERNDCVITRNDGTDIDAILLEQIRSWYIKSLSEIPIDLLPCSDITDSLNLQPIDKSSAWSALPDNCFRVASVTATQWGKPALIVTDLSSAEAQAQSNPFSRADKEHPAAIVNSNTITFFPAPESVESLSVKAVLMPDKDATEYPFTPVLLAQIPFSE